MGEPGFDPDNDVITVRSADGSLIAVGTFASRAPHVHTWSEGFVDPDHVDRGIGSALLSWAGDRATAAIGRAPEGARVTMAVGAHDHNERAKRLFTRNGFTLERYFLEMVIDLDGPVTVQPVPDGITVRTIGADEGLEGLAVAVADSFRDHFGYTDQPLESRIARWEQWRTSELWDDDLVWIAENDGRIVAMNVCISSNGAKQHEGYVATLGVLPDWRGRGLARALLTMSFAEFLRRGKSSVSLHVDADSLTGATRLYEGVGMREVERHVDFERELRPGEDLVVR
jgi:mycothiol synthase